MKIAANGITLHAEESGAGDLALVFLHYWGGTARTWKSVIGALPADLRAVALDARGWGSSDRPADGYDIATMAADVEAAIGALGLKRYVLIGHSMGGKVAQLLASRRPSGLGGLVLVAPSPAQGKALGPEERAAMKGAYANSDAVRWTIDNVLAHRALALPLLEQAIADSLGGAPAAKSAWSGFAISEDVSAGLPRIAVPVLVIGGEMDKVDSVDMLRSVVLPALPHAALSVIAGTGHLLPLEAPRELAERILAFIDQEVSGPRQAPLRPEDIPAAFDAALNRGDVDALMALFHPGATMRMTDGSIIVEEPAALREALADLIALRPSLRNIVRRVLVSGDVALLLLDWEIRVALPGEAERVERGTATQVAERSADRTWLLRIANPLGIN